MEPQAMSALEAQGMRAVEPLEKCALESEMHTQKPLRETSTLFLEPPGEVRAQEPHEARAKERQERLA